MALEDSQVWIAYWIPSGSDLMNLKSRLERSLDLEGLVRASKVTRDLPSKSTLSPGMWGKWLPTFLPWGTTVHYHWRCCHLNWLLYWLWQDLLDLMIFPIWIWDSWGHYQKEFSKQSRPGNPPKPFLFPSYPVDTRLCPKQTLLDYISRTESFRSSGTGQKVYLFHILNLTAQYHHPL